MNIRNTLQLRSSFACLALSCKADIYVRQIIRNGYISITYKQRKDNYLYCGERFIENTQIKLSTKYTILREQLGLTFPDRHIDGYQVSQVIDEYLKKNILGYKMSRLADQFTDTVDKLINCCWEKVVASTKSVSYKHLREYSSEAVAVAMEGNGFYWLRGHTIRKRSR